MICSAGAFLNADDIGGGMTPLVVMTVIALLFGIHMVMAIGGADMPVVVSMLNSYPAGPRRPPASCCPTTC